MIKDKGNTYIEVLRVRFEYNHLKDTKWISKPELKVLPNTVIWLAGWDTMYMVA